MVNEFYLYSNSRKLNLFRFYLVLCPTAPVPNGATALKWKKMLQVGMKRIFAKFLDLVKPPSKGISKHPGISSLQ